MRTRPLNSQSPEPFARRLLAAADALGWPLVGWALIATAIYAVEGEEIVRDGGPRLLVVLATYALAAAAAVLLLAFLRPFARGRLLTTLVSVAVASPAGLMYVFFYRDGDVTRLTGADLAVALGIAAVVGPLATAYHHARTHQRDRAT